MKFYQKNALMNQHSFFVKLFFNLWFQSVKFSIHIDLNLMFTDLDFDWLIRNNRMHSWCVFTIGNILCYMECFFLSWGNINTSACAVSKHRYCQKPFSLFGNHSFIATQEKAYYGKLSILLLSFIEFCLTGRFTIIRFIYISTNLLFN